MENGKVVTHNSMRRIMGNHQLVIITQLLQRVETMQNIDELFVWLSDIMMQRMDIQIVQFWGMQGYRNGNVGCELRTSMHQNTSLPQHIMINQPIADTMENLLTTRQSVVPQPVKNIFSRYLSKQLMRYNLNYWACQFISDTILLPPSNISSAHEKIATPLMLEVSVFSQHTPSSRLLPTLSHILEHVLPIARQHGLLTVPPTTVSSRMERGLQVSNNQCAGKSPALTEFIPYPLQSIDAQKEALTNEKFPIQDNNARRLYLEIDGHKNVGELACITQLNAQEFYTALCLLLAQKCIMLFDRRDLQNRGTQLSLKPPPVSRVYQQ